MGKLYTSIGRLQAKQYPVEWQGGKGIDLNTLVDHDAICTKCGCVHEQHTARGTDCTVDTRYGNARDRAKKANGRKGKSIEFLLTLPELGVLWRLLPSILVCYMCGMPEQYSQLLVRPLLNSKYPTVRFGLDRGDSSDAYRQGNLSFCCWECNKRKGDESMLEFLTHFAAGSSSLWIERARRRGLHVPENWYQHMLLTRSATDAWNSDQYVAPDVEASIYFNEQLLLKEGYDVCKDDLRKFAA